MPKDSAELVLDVPEMWRKGNIIYMRVPVPSGGTVIRAYEMDVAMRTHREFGFLISQFREEQAQVARIRAA